MPHALRVARVLVPLALVLLGLLGAPPAAASGASAAAEPVADGPRLVILGFDGADGRTIEELVAAEPERYPTFARLAEQGTLARLQTVSPPESPVSWAALNTGRNPAETGVPGFVRRVLPSSAGLPPMPGLGHIVPEERALEEFDDAPIPTWPAWALGAAAGTATFVVFLLVFVVLLRMRLLVGGVLALVLGGVGAWCGWEVRGLLPQSYPRYANPNKARNFWDHLADEGVPSIVLDAAQAFDMPSGESARVLAGLGVPDARGGLGDWAIYTTDDLEFNEPPEGRNTGTAGKVFRVYPSRDDETRIESAVYGPPNFWVEEKLERELERLDERLNDPMLGYEESLELNERLAEVEDRLDRVRKEGTSVPLVVDLGDGEAVVRLGEEEQTLAVGEWSDYYHLTFELNWLVKVHAVTRVKLVSIEPHFELFVNVLDIDPEKPPFWQAISTPFAFSAELAERTGEPYETYGWPTATMPFKDGVVSPELLMEDVEFTMRWQERLTYDSLRRDDWRLLMSVISVTDRVQHMMYQYYDEEHPLYDAEEAEKTFTFFGETISRKEAIPAIYRQMDRVVGTVLDEHLGPEDALLVCSDHGFQSFRRQVHINNWLAEAGYLKLKDPLPRKAEQLNFVDWSQTQAYSLGLGFVFLNLKGREPSGIVDPADAPELLQRIRSDLLAAEDEATGERVANDAYVVSEIHGGPYLDMEADLITGFAPGYRVSWGTTFGGLSVEEGEDGRTRPASFTEDNDKNWSGGHVSCALPDVAGVFLSNRRVEVPEEGPSLLQIAPTALSFLGVAVPEEMDMPPLEIGR